MGPHTDTHRHTQPHTVHTHTHTHTHIHTHNQGCEFSVYRRNSVYFVESQDPNLCLKHPYFTLKGLIFILEVKFQSFLLAAILTQVPMSSANLRFQKRAVPNFSLF